MIEGFSVLSVRKKQLSKEIREWLSCEILTCIYVTTRYYEIDTIRQIEGCPLTVNSPEDV